MLKDKRKSKHIKTSIKSISGRNTVEDKNRSKEQGQK